MDRHRRAAIGRSSNRHYRGGLQPRPILSQRRARWPRLKFSKAQTHRLLAIKDAFVADIRRALYAAKICSYAQGYQLLALAAREYGWELNYGGIALLWRGGCIIRAQFLGRIKEAFDADPTLANLLLAPYFSVAIAQTQASWRRVVATATTLGIPVRPLPVPLRTTTAIAPPAYPPTCLQAQRDYFGASHL